MIYLIDKVYIVNLLFYFYFLTSVSNQTLTTKDKQKDY